MASDEHDVSGRTRHLDAGTEVRIPGPDLARHHGAVHLAGHRAARRGGLLIGAMTRLYLVTLPVIIALILSTLCVPPARRLERAGWPRLAAAVVVVVGGVGSFFGLLALLTPAFVRQIQELGPTVAEGFEQLLVWLEEGPIGYDRRSWTSCSRPRWTRSPDRPARSPASSGHSRSPWWRGSPRWRWRWSCCSSSSRTGSRSSAGSGG
jgi:hypothetical protein